MPNPSHEDIIGSQGLPLVFDVSGSRAALADARPMNEHSCRMLVWSLAGFQKDAVLTSEQTGKSWRLPSDEGSHMAGHDAAPAPLDYISAGMAKACLDEIQALAARRSLDIGPVGLKVDNFYKTEGAALKKTMTGIPLPFTVTAAFSRADISREVLAELARDAIHIAPTAGLFSQITRGLFSVCLNGKQLDIDTLPQCAPLANDLRQFASLEGAKDPHQKSLLTRDGDATASTAGHPVHVSGTVTKSNVDGPDTIRMELCAPVGSAWQIDVDGIVGRAPDPLSLVSSGMGFCFMTKLHMLAARYKIPIDASYVLQETRFGPGGATDKTQRAPGFSPVKTQLDIWSPASEGAIAELVTLTEPACYVHMACQRVLKPRLRIAEHAPSA